MRFLIGGGCDINHVGIAVLLANQKIANATGNCHESMQEKQFDLGAYIGQKLRVKIYDNASGGWGHINVDDIRFEDY
uniref:Uncharacterized protein n=1 Tax=Candidatus Kentrum sp. SD TaxID=2126332 RepID=A0A450YUU5_9GAMM|nr:MAG: hypothetical protein BECKSD772F_GA0070984_12158 [Candidatus Kentron sp. SD]VFK49708.1 MAG: hypothetical protein BECKSD772E_GA0070983_12197 [Candidatus Kentron sp. SD]VFK80792.1 MAG: hypothetical protein BECKSD772D_GA0070982_11572 [Candidatus Kentron sp. SD]